MAHGRYVCFFDGGMLRPLNAQVLDSVVRRLLCTFLFPLSSFIGRHLRFGLVVRLLRVASPSGSRSISGLSSRLSKSILHSRQLFLIPYCLGYISCPTLPNSRQFSPFLANSCHSALTRGMSLMKDFKDYQLKQPQLCYPKNYWETLPAVDNKFILGFKC